MEAWWGVMWCDGVGGIERLMFEPVVDCGDNKYIVNEVSHFQQHMVSSFSSIII